MAAVHRNTSDRVRISDANPSLTRFETEDTDWQPEESAPLLRRRARTGSGRGFLPNAGGASSRALGFGSRNIGKNSTILDRLLYCYDQRPLKQSGFWLRPSRSTVHLCEDDLVVVSSDSEDDERYFSPTQVHGIGFDSQEGTPPETSEGGPKAVQKLRSFTAPDQVVDRTLPETRLERQVSSPIYPQDILTDISLSGLCYVRLLSNDAPLPKVIDVESTKNITAGARDTLYASDIYCTIPDLSDGDGGSGGFVQPGRRRSMPEKVINLTGSYRIKNDTVLNGWPVWMDADSRVVLASTPDAKWCFAKSVRAINAKYYYAQTVDPHQGDLPNEYKGFWLEGKNGTSLPGLSISLPPTEFLLVMGWLALVVGVTFMSAIGPFASRIAVNGYLLGCWVAQAMSLCFLALSIAFLAVARRHEGRSTTSPLWLLRWRNSSDPEDNSPGGLPVLLLSGVCSGLGSGCWTLSFSLTPIPLAYLFASFGPSVIVFFRMLAPSAGVPPARLEVMGVAIGVIGCLITCVGSLTGTSGFGLVQLGGNILAFVCSVTNAVCGMCGKYASCVPTVLYLTGVCVLSGLTQLVLSYLFLPVSFDTHPTTGVFGWLNPVWYPNFILIVISFVVGQWGLFFFLQVGTALQQATVMTSQPVITTILGVAVLGTQSDWPNLYIMLGGVITILGSLLVIVGGQHHEIPSDS
eukprot:TRINITY_DN1728_c0_g1_i1.p1 TRINITY_DN1728_c0_g1~~TRINITY_DN1728_c0_g1_i1.p1  ORF type:complete len:691 (+),score=225.43 TRINITY_DN1728_c0_g1_i1:171-2243(+)